MSRAENKQTAGTTTRYVAEIARTMREQQKLSQEQLGKRIGYTGSAVSAMETCAQPASDDMLVKLEGAIGAGLGLFEKARPYVRLDKYPAPFRTSHFWSRRR